MFTRLFGMVVLKMIVLHIALRCGLGAFSWSLCFFANDLPCAVVNVTLLKRRKFLSYKELATEQKESELLERTEA